MIINHRYDNEYKEKILRDYAKWYQQGVGYSYKDNDAPPVKFLKTSFNEYPLTEIQIFVNNYNWADADWQKQLLVYYDFLKRRELIKLWTED